MDLSQDYQQTGNGCRVFAAAAGAFSAVGTAALLWLSTLGAPWSEAMTQVEHLGAMLGGGLLLGSVIAGSMPLLAGLAVYAMARQFGCPPDSGVD